MHVVGPRCTFFRLLACIVPKKVPTSMGMLVNIGTMKKVIG